ncbi:ELL-associated factor 2 isoform X2 [Daktulosphaira vitifoliae]|uniref:ELL-associated factor 2 isoform X2 n=1 Tax=Daktulosphaira vitifoliae TaxID=58002 RepID=UPI0021AAE47F|nr:ELL-associated factor 2 isoform X2 [Daktulosphaira vitifoliae]
MDDESSDPLGFIGSEPAELKFGSTFSGKGPGFHTLRYDFKPASIDINKPASVDISPSTREVTVTVPNFEGAGTAHTVYKGSQKDYTKECVLIIDHATGEITLEKLTNNVQLKSTRNAVEKSQKPIVQINPVLSEKNRPTNIDKRLKGKSLPIKQVTKSPKKTPQSPKVANLSPPSNAQHVNKSPQFFMSESPMSSSLPLLNDDDCSMTGFDSQAHPSFSLSDIKTEIKTDMKQEAYDDLVPAAGSLELSESSSDSGSSSSSDSDSDDSTPPPSKQHVAKQTTPTLNSSNTNGRLVDPGRILDEDLQLSETDSD